MGDSNQLLYVKKHQKELVGPYLEVGSKDYGSTQDLRKLFADKDTYVGTDMLAGPGVDVVLDLTQDFEEIDANLGGVRFGTIICLSVLEHCEQPFKMAENLTSLIKPGGKICLSVPFSWKVHAYPSDYWRFTPEGVEKLFPKLVFDTKHSVMATSAKNDLRTLSREIGKIHFSSTTYLRNGYPFRAITAKILRAFGKFSLLSWFSGYRYVLAPTNIYMIGTLGKQQGN